jgi:hypothetical protein
MTGFSEYHNEDPDNDGIVNMKAVLQVCRRYYAFELSSFLTGSRSQMKPALSVLQITFNPAPRLSLTTCGLNSQRMCRHVSLWLQIAGKTGSKKLSINQAPGSGRVSSRARWMSSMAGEGRERR